jgi:hypothetical protein
MATDSGAAHAAVPEDAMTFLSRSRAEWPRLADRFVSAPSQAGNVQRRPIKRGP